MAPKFAQRVFFLFVTGIGLFSASWAQQTEKTGIEDRLLRKDQNQIQSQQNLQNVKIVVMDGPVDPREYVVGPGDIYSVNVWMSPPLSLQVPVTPEGSVIIPSVGEIPVAGLHLDEAKKKVVSTMAKKYLSGEISFTLLTPRMFAVTVKGVVRKEGTVYLLATERVDAAIQLANSIDEKNTRNEVPDDERQESLGRLIVRRDSIGSLRRIIIHHKDGSQGSADLEKYFAGKEPRLNPLLRDGDVIIVPKQNTGWDFIGIYGAVNKEGAYEFVPGDSLVGALKMARGLTGLADSDHIEITRTDELGRMARTDTVSLKEISTKTVVDYPLHRGDRIVVREKLQLQRDYKVFIQGEVVYPGYFPIDRDSTTLSQVIQKAGGFRPNAFLSASQVYRRPKTTNNPTWGRLESERGMSMQEDTTYYRIENYIREKGEPVVVDFAGLFVDKDKANDIFLQDGDRIVITSRTRTIYVFGQVTRPGHVAFVKDRGYKYYIAQAGGVTGDAKSGDIRIIKAGNKQWLDPGDTEIEEGDQVWVPKDPYRPFTYYMQTYSQVFGILGTIATLAVLISQLSK